MAKLALICDIIYSYVVVYSKGTRVVNMGLKMVNNVLKESRIK